MGEFLPSCVGNRTGRKKPQQPLVLRENELEDKPQAAYPLNKHFLDHDSYFALLIVIPWNAERVSVSLLIAQRLLWFLPDALNKWCLFSKKNKKPFPLSFFDSRCIHPL